MRLCLLIWILFSTSAQAQTDTVYFDENWRVSVQDSAAYMRPPAEKLASGKYRVVDYYINSGQPQMVGEYLDMGLKIEDGYFVRYHKNGKLESEGKSVKGKKEGHWIGYHKNGNKSSEGSFGNGARNGIWRWYAEDGTAITFYATFKQGFYHGDVVRYHTNGKVARMDRYKNNKFKSGKCFSFAGLDTTWYPDRTYPTFQGGDEKYSKFVNSDERYKKFRESNRKIKGKVYVEVYFDETGRMYKSEVVQSLSPEADKLALDLVRSMPDWLPALDESNRPVKSTRTLDIRF